MNKFVDKMFDINAVNAGFIADWLSELHREVVDVKIANCDHGIYVLVQLKAKTYGQEKQ